MAFSLLKIAVISFLATLSLACSCLRLTFEKSYCDASTAFRGKVIARTDNCQGSCDPINDQIKGQIIYIVQILQKFKGAPAEDNIIYLKTATNSAACGVALEVGTVYLLKLGTRQTDRRRCPRFFYSIGLCSFPTPWAPLPKHLKNFVIENGQSRCPPSKTVT